VLVGLVVSAFQLGIQQTLAWYGNAVHLATGSLGVPDWLAAAVLGAAMVMGAVALLRRFAPEAAGSGVHEVEAHLDGLHPLRWRRVLPVKFFGGILALGAHLAVGPEGPAVHMGGAVGRMIGDRFKFRGEHGKALVCAGAAAGLAAVFNAPIAGFLFVLEQMRRHFPLTFVSFQGLVVASWTGSVVAALFFGQGPPFPIREYVTPALLDLTLFLALGAAVGVFGAMLNTVLLATIRGLERIRRRRPNLLPACVGAATGVLAYVLPQSVGSGQSLTLDLFLHPYVWPLLLVLLVARLGTTVVSYAAGTPGGIFAPLLAIGALAGLVCGQLFGAIFPGLVAEPGVYALAAMGALFAAMFRIPLTAIVLVLEITRSGSVALAMIASCLAASLAAQAVGAQPLYDVLLARLRAERSETDPEDDQRSPTTTKSPTTAS
jgi:chloride channel protein, CIC family